MHTDTFHSLPRKGRNYVGTRKKRIIHTLALHNKFTTVVYGLDCN